MDDRYAVLTRDEITRGTLGISPNRFAAFFGDVDEVVVSPEIAVHVWKSGRDRAIIDAPEDVGYLFTHVNGKKTMEQWFDELIHATQRLIIAREHELDPEIFAVASEFDTFDRRRHRHVRNQLELFKRGEKNSPNPKNIFNYAQDDARALVCQLYYQLDARIGRGTISESEIAWIRYIINAAGSDEMRLRFLEPMCRLYKKLRAG